MVPLLRVPLAPLLTGAALGFFFVTRDLGAIADSCSSDLSPITRIPYVDDFLFFVISLFQQVDRTPEGRFVTSTSFGAALPLLFFFGVESGRQGVTGMARYGLLLAILGWILPMASVLNLLLVPAFIYSQSEYLESLVKRVRGGGGPQSPHIGDASSSSPSAHVQDAAGGIIAPVRGVTRVHAQTVSAVILALALLVSVMINVPARSTVYVAVNTAFQFFPLVFTLPYILARPPPSPETLILSADSLRTIKMVYMVLAGFSTAWYVQSVIELLGSCALFNPKVTGSLSVWLWAAVEALGKLDFSSGPVRAFAADLVGICLAPVFIFLSENYSTDQIVWYAFSSFFISPGAAAAYLLHEREAKEVAGPSAVISGGIGGGGIRQHVA